MGKMSKFSSFVAWKSREANGVFRCPLINHEMCLIKAWVKCLCKVGLGCRNGCVKWPIMLDTC